MVRLDHDVMIDGEWKVSFASKEKGFHNFTLSGNRWRKLQERCKPGRTQDIHPTYIGCENLFDFQGFVEWSKLEVGYELKESNGKRWQLDKDLSFKGNKAYSPETCIFVPARVNTFTIMRTNDRGNYPLGVHLVTNPCHYFVSRCSSGGKSHNLGNYHCPFEAHRAWQKKKIELGREMAHEFKNSHEKLYFYLNGWVDSIQDDFVNFKETKG